MERMAEELSRYLRGLDRVLREVRNTIGAVRRAADMARGG